jgi:hypothetical protein
MSEKDLATALQQIISADFRPAPDPRQVVIDVVRHEQRKSRVLAFLSVVFWLVAVAGLLFFLLALHRFVVCIRITPWPWRGADRPVVDAARAEETLIWGTQLLHHYMPYAAGAIVALLLAALCTVLLVFSSRRATLHQIHLALMALSDQLKELRHLPAAGAGRGEGVPRSETS